MFHLRRPTALKVGSALFVSGLALISMQPSIVAATEAKKHKLTYFNIAGLAFPIRAALRAGNVSFEDNRLQGRDDFLALRGPNECNQAVPLGQVPTLTLSTGQTLCQSSAILRWAGKQSNLYPVDITQALLCDELIDSLGELRNKIPQHKDEAERKRLREEFVAKDFAKYMEYFTRRLKETGGPYLVGKNLTIADLGLARFVAGIVEGGVDFIGQAQVEKYPVVFTYYQQVVKHPIYSNEVKAEALVKK
jgi:glutathione S-transferase